MPDWGDKQVDQLRFMAQRYPTEVAYRDLTRAAAITFAEWNEQSNRLARGLAHHGVRAGDRVSIYLPSEEVLRWIVVYAAVHKAGAVAVPTNTRLTVPEVATVLGHAEVAALVTSAQLLSNACAVRDDVGFDLLVSAGGDAPGVTTYDAMLDRDTEDFQAGVEPSDLADIMYTSGTTGLPKGVAVRHSNVAMIPNLEPNWTGGGWLHGAPLFTFAGIAFIFNPMKLGLRGLYMTPFDAGRWLDAVERERPVMAMLVPAMVELIVAHPDFERRDLSSLQVVSIGAAPIAPATLARMQQRLPDATVSNSYGMTEAGPAFIVMPKEELTKRPGSVGKPIPPMEIKVVDDGGEKCAPEEVGELLTRMPGAQREYYKDADATSDTWTPDGWLRTGDLAKLDADGFLYIVGRKKDVIIRGGHNVYATDVEGVIMGHPAVQETAVVGVPHKTLGEDVAAFVVLRPNDELTAEELQAFCAARLADYKCPRQIHFVDDLPRNATQKVMKHLLVSPPTT